VCLVLTDIALLIPAFALLVAPPVLAVWLLCVKNAPLPSHLSQDGIHGFGTVLEPRYVVGATTLDQ
jgi:hypothetical protein